MRVNYSLRSSCYWLDEFNKRLRCCLPSDLDLGELFVETEGVGIPKFSFSSIQERFDNFEVRRLLGQSRTSTIRRTNYSSTSRLALRLSPVDKWKRIRSHCVSHNVSILFRVRSTFYADDRNRTVRSKASPDNGISPKGFPVGISVLRVESFSFGTFYIAFAVGFKQHILRFIWTTIHHIWGVQLRLVCAHATRARLFLAEMNDFLKGLRPRSPHTVTTSDSPQRRLGLQWRRYKTKNNSSSDSRAFSSKA